MINFMKKGNKGQKLKSKNFNKYKIEHIISKIRTTH